MQYGILILLLVPSIMILSCVSPLEPDTPRNRYEDSPPITTGRIHARLIRMDVLENQRPWIAAAIDTSIQIDTTLSLPSVWIDSRFLGTSGLPFHADQLSSLTLRVDSFYLGQTSLNLSQHPHWAAFVVSSSPDSGLTFHHDTLMANPATGQATLSFLYNSVQRQVTANLSAHLTAYRMTVTGTFVFDY